MSATQVRELTSRPPRSEVAPGDRSSAVIVQRIARSAWIIGGIGLLCIVAFDLGPPLAFNDDWVMAWGVRHFDPSHLQLYPASSAIALVQTVFAWVVTLGHADQRLLRLTEVAFIGLTMVSTHRLARRLGANAAWSSMAAVSPLAFPVFTADATTFMTDVPYVGLLMVAALGAFRWHEGRRWIALCVAFSVLATLQRQTGIMVAPAVTLVLLLFRKEGIARRDWIGLAALWIGCFAAIVLPAVTGITPPTQANRLHAAAAPDPIYVLTSFMFLPGLIGLGLLPFLPGLALSGEPRQAVDRGRLVVFAVLVVELLIFAVNSFDVFPGNVFQPRGFNLTGLMPYLKPQVFPAPVFLLIEIGSVATIAFMILRWHSFTLQQVGPGGACLLLISGFQFLPLTLVHYVAYDRYYLPVVAMLVPFAARAASRTSNLLLSGRISLALIAAMVVVYVAGEQDFQAWEVARDETARLAYQQASPYQVNAGYEANAVYGELPWYERTGALIGGTGVPGAYDFSADGPRDPKLVLQFAPADDPAEGYTWSSLAPGKVVIRPAI